MNDVDVRYRDSLSRLAQIDAEKVLQKDIEYGGSWKRRGGVGAFMMLARKWDRIEPQVAMHHYDIFAAAEKDQRPDGLIDDIRDLRRYLLLVEAELEVRHGDVIMARKVDA
jgi:hypothetical protein